VMCENEAVCKKKLRKLVINRALIIANPGVY